MPTGDWNSEIPLALLSKWCFTIQITWKLRNKQTIYTHTKKRFSWEKISSMELPVIWETQQPKHKLSISTNICYFYCSECPQIYPNYLYIEMCHLIVHKVCQNLCHVYFEHLPKILKLYPSFSPTWQPCTHFWKWKHKWHLSNTKSIYYISSIDISIIKHKFILSEISPTLCSDVQNRATPKI